jgi:hypothetical protein
MAMWMAPPKLGAAFTFPKFVSCFSLLMNAPPLFELFSYWNTSQRKRKGQALF